jgi:hypothetical protein
MQRRNADFESSSDRAGEHSRYRATVTSTKAILLVSILFLGRELTKTIEHPDSRPRGRPKGLDVS